MKMKGALGAAAVGLAAAALAAPAMAASHGWEINEVFSNADGTIQFIELMNPTAAGNETGLNGKWVLSVVGGMQFDFPGNLPCNDCTAFKHLLLATAGFAALPGAPTPDYIIADNFFALDGDTIEYWFYDSWSFGPGDLPTNGFHSLNRDLTTGPNTPTNFADETGEVNACPADLDHNGTVSTSDLLDLLSAWGTDPGGPPDFDGSGNVGTSDLLYLLGEWGRCS